MSSDGRREHLRKVEAAQKAREQAATIRDKLNQIDQAKKEAAEKERIRQAAIQEALRKKQAEEAERNARARKIFVCGDTKGNLLRLSSTVEAQAAKVGPFEMLLGVGSFLPAPDGQEAVGGMASYLSGERSLSLKTYFIDDSAALLHSAPQGRELCQNLFFLGGYGVRDLEGLRVAFLSGRYDADLYGTADVDFIGGAFTCRAVRELQKLVSEDRQKRGVDILLTCGWPADIDLELPDEASRPSVLEDGPSWRESAAPPLAELCLAIEPRYHLFGRADLFFQRVPFKVLRRDHVCRCIGLGKVGSNSKQRKWLHALSLSPMQYMRKEDLRQSPANATACPLQAGRKRSAADAEQEEEPAAKRSCPPRARSQGGDAADDETHQLSEKALNALKALFSGDPATYTSVAKELEAAAVVSACATPAKQPAKPAPKKEAEAPAETSAAPSEVQRSELTPVVPPPLSGADEERAEAAREFLAKPPAEGVVRYTFEAQGPLGIRLSRDVPPWVLEVRDGTLAARKAPRVPLGGIVLAVNGYELMEKGNEAATQALASRPVILDIEWPGDQGTPTVNRA